MLPFLLIRFMDMKFEARKYFTRHAIEVQKTKVVTIIILTVDTRLQITRTNMRMTVYLQIQSVHRQ